MAGLVLVAVAVVVLAAGAAPASAHAVLQSSQPADGDHLASAPTTVTLQFDEPVKADLGGLRVVDAGGGRVDTGADRTPGTSLSVDLKGGLGDGTYVASYRVVSADGHTVKGAIVFSVGAAPAGAVDPAALTPGSSGDAAFEVLGAASRFLAYVGALGAAGLAFFLFFLHDGGPEAPSLRRLVRVGAAVGALGAVGTLTTQAALATGRGWDAATDLAVLRQVLTDSLDWATVVLLVGLTVVVGSLGARRRATGQALAFYGGLATALSFVLWGHARQGDHRWATMIADGVHVVAAAAWLGGLVGLTVVVRARTRRRRRRQRPRHHRRRPTRRRRRGSEEPPWWCRGSPPWPS